MISILVATGVGYLIGSWNPTAVSGKEPSGAQTPAQTVALRFPQGLSEAPVVQATASEPAAAAKASAMGEAQLALFEPEPMVPAPASPQAVQPAPAETAELPPAPSAPAAEPPIRPKSEHPVTAAKPHREAAPRVANRSGHMLDDEQIASIKRRLHLTPDQERMWPSVEAALRTIAFTRAREARRGAPGSIDPDSAEVQDLKSAAIPLLMSFSDQQKDEVRNLARGMGLNQLASEF